MTDRDRLFDAFGELLYVVAKVDGKIQPAELKKIEEILKGHPWAKEIQWSFNYEMEHDTPIEGLYEKVLIAFERYGPTPDYTKFIEAMEQVAAASAGIDNAEKAVIDSLPRDLTNRFRQDLERINRR